MNTRIPIYFGMQLWFYIEDKDVMSRYFKSIMTYGDGTHRFNEWKGVTLTRIVRL